MKCRAAFEENYEEYTNKVNEFLDVYGDMLYDYEEAMTLYNASV